MRHYFLWNQYFLTAFDTHVVRTQIDRFLFIQGKLSHNLVDCLFKLSSNWQYCTLLAARQNKTVVLLLVYFKQISWNKIELKTISGSCRMWDFSIFITRIYSYASCFAFAQLMLRLKVHIFMQILQNYNFVTTSRLNGHSHIPIHLLSVMFMQNEMIFLI